MSRGRQRFTQRAVARAIKGVLAAGVVVRGVEVDESGTIRVLVVRDGEQERELQPTDLNELDRELERFNARHGNTN